MRTSNPWLRPVALLWATTAALAAQAIEPAESTEECTVGVACGEATPDGRPLLWKNRDTSSEHNEVVHFTDGRYEYLALVTAGQQKSAWAGCNEKGFCIMNSVSPDFRRARKRGGLGNGGFMKLALQTCATVAEFEQLLHRTNKTGRRTRSNFGVIDAVGAAAVFETSPAGFQRFDAGDPEVATQGFIVRSNFALTAVDNDEVKARSIERYRRGNLLCLAAGSRKELTPSQLLRQFCRDLADQDGNPLTMPIDQQVGKAPAGTLDNNRCISRSNTRSAVVFHGIKAGEDPRLTTFWVILGEPLFSIAVPCWVWAGGVAAELDGEQRSPLCTAAIQIKAEHYLVRDSSGAAKSGSKRRRGRSKKQFLKTAGLPGIWRRTYPVEDKIFDATRRRLAQWRVAVPKPGDVRGFHDRMARRAYQALVELVPARVGNK